LSETKSAVFAILMYFAQRIKQSSFARKTTSARTMKQKPFEGASIDDFHYKLEWM